MSQASKESNLVCPSTPVGQAAQLDPGRCGRAQSDQRLRAWSVGALLGCAVLAWGAPIGAQIPFESLAEYPLLNGAYSVELGDFDENGTLDVLTVPELDLLFSNNVTYNVLAGVGDGSLAAPVQGQTLTTHLLGSAGVADVNGNGHLDWVAIEGEALGRAVFFEGSGAIPFGSFSYEGSTLSGSGALGRIVDLQGNDGHLDVIKIGFTGPFSPGDAFSALVADGLGGFTQIGGHGLSTGGGHSLAVGDLDDDGFMDVVVTNSSSLFTISVFMGLSTTTWAPAVEVSAGAGTPYDVELVDLDGNGDLDMVVGNGMGGLMFFPGQGDGTFGSIVFSPAAGASTAMQVGDLDGDAELDAVTSDINGSIDIWKGAGDGSFALVNTFAATIPADLKLGDLDGDGDLDVVVALNTGLFGTDEVGVLINRSYGAGSPFTDLGKALAGSSGLPIHLAEGSLLPGTPGAFELFGGAPGELGFFIMGFNEANLAFEGGVLVPSVDKILLRGIDGLGQADISGLWPNNIPSGTTLFLQWWFEDVGGVFGYASSNAVRIDVP